MFAVKRQILQFQSPTTGMFPHDLSQPGSIEAHVRDSLYCASAVWALSQAFKLVSSGLCRFQGTGKLRELFLKLKCRQYPAIHTNITVDQTAPFQTRNILIDLVSSW